MSVLRKFFLIAALLAAFASLPATAQKVETDYDHTETSRSSTPIPGVMSIPRILSPKRGSVRMSTASFRRGGGRRYPWEEM
jgi:hypothetical protein